MKTKDKKNIAIWTVASVGIFFSLGTNPFDFGANVSEYSYADPITFDLGVGESKTYKVDHVCQAAHMPNGEPYWIETQGRFDLNVPAGATENVMVQLTSKNQVGETHVENVVAMPGSLAQVVVNSTLNETWSSGDACSFTGWITIEHQSGGSVNVVLKPVGVLGFNNAPSGVDVAAINYGITASLE